MDGRQFQDTKVTMFTPLETRSSVRPSKSLFWEKRKGRRRRGHRKREEEEEANSPTGVSSGDDDGRPGTVGWHEGKINRDIECYRELEESNKLYFAANSYRRSI